MTDRSDTELMLLVQAGDLAAFEKLVARFQSMVFGLAMSMLRRAEDAEEATQDTFLKLFRARERFDGERSLGPWLLRIAGNACRDRLRRRRTAELPVFRLDGDDRDPLLEVPDPRSGLGAAQEHLAPTVRGELEQLSEKVRLPLELKYLRGLTNQQIAEALGISVSNVKIQVARGKDVLASRLHGIGAGFGRPSGQGQGVGTQRAGDGRGALGRRLVDGDGTIEGNGEARGGDA